MSFLTKIGGAFSGGANKLSGRKDYLEGLTSAVAYMSSCDGKIGDDELDAGMKSINSIPAITSAYDTHAISSSLDGMLKRAGGGRMGRRGLMKEMEDLQKSDFSEREAILLVALDVADQGGIGDDEKKAAGDIAQALGLDVAKYI